MLLSQQSAATTLPHGKTGDRTDRPVMLFAPWCYGHHPNYLRYLIQYYLQQAEVLPSGVLPSGTLPSGVLPSGTLPSGTLQRSLKIVVSPDFPRAHADVMQMVPADSGIEFVPMSAVEQTRLQQTTGFQRGQIQADLIAKYAKQLQGKEVLILYFDSCQLPFVLGFKLPCPFSVILFRITFHYPTEAHASLRQAARSQLQSIRERSCLQWILRHPQLNKLFCLDPLAIAPINALTFRRFNKAIHLPDPVEVQTIPYRADQIRSGKARLGIDPDRKVLLSFGRLTETRKGIPQLLEAIAQLSHPLAQQITLLFVGEPDEAGMHQLEQWLLPLRQKSAVQIVTQYGYVPESEVSFYFQLSDAVLAPYQRHVGMSGILLLAAAAKKPVLSSNYGLMGELIRQYHLGIAVDSTQPTELAKGLIRLLHQYLIDRTGMDRTGMDRTDLDPGGDRPNSIAYLEMTKWMDQFVQENSSDQFAKTIFQHLLTE